MRSRKRHAQSSPVAAPALAPLLDVIFAVLACFAVMLTMSDPIPAGLSVSLPQADATVTSRGPSDILDVFYSDDGRVFVGDIEIELDRLEFVLQQSINSDDPPPIRLRGHRDAPHGTTVAVLEVLAKLGVPDVTIAVDPVSKGVR